MQAQHKISDEEAFKKLEPLWRKEFRNTSEKRAYVLALLTALLLPATLIDLTGEVQNRTLLIASRLLPPALIIMFALGQKFLKFPYQLTYYVIVIGAVTAITVRTTTADLGNFLSTIGTTFLMLGILISIRYKDALFLAIYAIFIHVLVYFFLYAGHIPLNSSGLLVVVALSVIFVLLVKFRYENLRRNYLNNMLISLQKEEIEEQHKALIDLNEEINQQKEEILAQSNKLEQNNLALKETLATLSKKNASITASLNYAKRIQEAMLPTSETIRRYYPESFVFYKPRDIVSGDFYWIGKVGNRIVFAVGDCTGHGAPGAFMSIMATTLLTQIIEVEKITQPAEVLRNLHLKIRSGLKQTETRNRDGIDISVCTYEPTQKKLSFAGAHSHLFYLHKQEIRKIKGDKMPVGGRQKEQIRLFTNHALSTQAITTCYMFSDGYQDQFGGPEKRKFMNQNLRTLLLKNSTKSFGEQKEQLRDTLENWIKEGNEKQIDDILVVGFTVSH